MSPLPSILRNRKVRENNQSTPAEPSRHESNSALRSKVFPIGLKCLYEPESAVVDVIFVHGLTGGMESTWTAANAVSPWPQTLLPTKLPDARILTFGYDADVVHWRATVSKSRIGNHAEDLLTAVASHRENDNTNYRPLLFVAHSLGGLVCEDALLASKNSAEKHLQNILSCTRGILFLGTPHMGSTLAAWVELLAKLISIVKQTNSQILEVLQHESEVLARIQKEFHSMIRARADNRDPSIAITCFYEQLPLPGIGEVVPKNSAILPAYTSIGIHDNHVGMTKFEAANDPGFKSVVGELHRWVKELKPVSVSELKIPQQKTQDQKACLQSLAFPEMSLRGNDIEDEAFETCDWLLSHKDYTSWFRQRNGLLWIKGKPGAGKSTLMKYAIQEAQRRGPSDGYVIASFFFHGRGAPIQKDPLGLFRSLLHQILDQIPELLFEFSSIFKKRCESEGEPGQKWNWHVTELRNFLNTALPRISKIYTIRIYVDALDECGEKNAKELVKHFDRLTSKLSSVETNLSICFSCRHYPLVALERGLAICVEDENSGDISRYVQNQLRQEFSDDIEAQDIGEEIVRRASGIFQWVVLVVATILRLSEEGDGIKTIQKKLREIPTELHTLYQDILDNIKQKDGSSRSLLLFQWICFAQRPLSLEELRFAMVVDANTTYTSLKECTESEAYAKSNEQMKKKIKSLSGGLVEVKEHENLHIAQFIHQSVNDYFIKSGLRLLDSSMTRSVIGQAHFRLSRSCIKYIAMKEVGEIISKYRREPARPGPELIRELPFLEYSITTWVSHAEIVEAEKIPQGDLLSLFQWPSNQILQCWIQLYNILDPRTDKCPNTNTTLLHLASQYNLMSLIKKILNSDQDIDADSKDRNDRTPLLLAAQSGHDAVVRLLLERDDVDADSKDENGQTPLFWAAESGHEAVVRLLLERDDVKADSMDIYDKTPLFRAVASTHEAVVRLLLERDDVDANIKDEDGRTLLLWAAFLGSEAVVRLLLERDDVEADSKDVNGVTPLSWAAEWGHEEVVRLLLQQDDVDADTKNRNSQTPLLLAAKSGHKAVVRLLLERDDVDADTKDDYGQTPLLGAAELGHEAMVQLLLERDNVDADSKDENGKTPLLWAAELGHEAMVRLLLERDNVDADFKDNKGRTPLLLAARSGHEAVVRLLLERDDVKADPKDIDGNTPLSRAAESGNEAVVRLLLERDDVDADSKDENGRTLLSRASESGHEAIVRLLLERDDVDADSKDDYGQTPLLRAAESEHEAVVRLLLERDDVDADTKDDYGQTPLLLAAKSGHEAVVRLLLERHDVEADFKDVYGATPLSWAAKFAYKGEDDYSLTPQLRAAAFRAATSKYEAVVRLLLERDDVKADSKDVDGATPLSWAAKSEHEAVVRLLLERDDVDANSKDNYGWTPLSRAARTGHEAVVRLLLERDDVKADPKDKYGNTPLSQAAESGHEAIVRLLLERDDVDANSKDADGATPLSCAAGRGHDAVVRLLLERDDVDADTKNKNGQTPLLLAAKSGHKAVVRLLLERDDVDANSKDEDGRTSLLWAAFLGSDAVVVRLLLERDDVEADSKDLYGLTPLSRAAELGHEEIVRLLLERDDVDADSKDADGDTPLSCAADRGHDAVVRLLLERDDVDANSKNENGQTPLSRAAESGHENVVRLLLERDDVDADSKDNLRSDAALVGDS